jgi:hypothetical protein
MIILKDRISFNIKYNSKNIDLFSQILFLKFPITQIFEDADFQFHLLLSDQID